MSYLVNDWKYEENLPAKNWYARSKFRKIQGMLEGSKVHAAWYPARLYKYYVKGVERKKKLMNT